MMLRFASLLILTRQKKKMCVDKHASGRNKIHQLRRIAVSILNCDEAKRQKKMSSLFLFPVLMECLLLPK